LQTSNSVDATVATSARDNNFLKARFAEKPLMNLNIQLAPDKGVPTELGCECEIARS
jgi:hypothetical protein